MSFATTEEVAARIGRDLTANEATMAEALLEAATALIADAAGKTDDWAAALSPVPKVLRTVAVEVVARVVTNPQGLSSSQETLGAYSHSERFRDAASGLLLTASEERLVRRAAGLRTSGSARVESVIDDLYGS